MPLFSPCSRQAPVDNRNRTGMICLFAVFVFIGVDMSRPPDPYRPDVVVIGGGLGGLATALRLQHSGHRVVVLEKNRTCGGKLAELHDQGFRWDMGPSLLTMPHVLDELFEFIGARRVDHLTLERMNPACRYFWPDGHQLDEDEAFFARPEVAAFLEYARGIYELSGEAFLTRPPDQWWRAMHPRNWPLLRHLPKLCTFATVASSVESRVADPHLRQLFQRFATYNGSDPFQAPAAFNVIPYVEATYGGWYVRGGMARIAVVLEELCRKSGVQLVTGAQVIRCDHREIQIQDGRRWSARHVVVNGDAIRAHRDWVRLPGWEHEAKKMLTPPLALSGFVMLLGVRHQYPHLSHHNIFFSADYRKEFRQLFELNLPAEDPTIYISITGRSDAADAPDGCDNYFVLVNAPAETDDIDWKAFGPSYSNLVIHKLEDMGLVGLSSKILRSHLFTPADFSARDLSMHGSLYGWASHSPRTAMLRPPMVSPLAPNWHFVGGTTHPGGGIPLVLLGAKMTAERIGPSADG